MVVYIRLIPDVSWTRRGQKRKGEIGLRPKRNCALQTVIVKTILGSEYTRTETERNCLRRLGTWKTDAAWSAEGWGRIPISLMLLLFVLQTGRRIDIRYALTRGGACASRPMQCSRRAARGQSGRVCVVRVSRTRTFYIHAPSGVTSSVRSVDE